MIVLVTLAGWTMLTVDLTMQTVGLMFWKPIWGGAGSQANDSDPQFSGSILDLIKSESRAQAEAVLKENEVKLTSPAIGHIYIQFRGQTEPATLYKGTVWANVSSMYAGCFFRAEGTVSCRYETPYQVICSDSALPFNSGLQVARLPNIRGRISLSSDAPYDLAMSGAFGYTTSRDPGWGLEDIGQAHRAFLDFNAFYSNPIYRDNVSLPIPANETFRIWKRTV